MCIIKKNKQIIQVSLTDNMAIITRLNSSICLLVSLCIFLIQSIQIIWYNKTKLLIKAYNSASLFIL